ncbi:MAG TPA: hypothetical protein DCY35_11485 [Prolixibacteraceae bacterium]|nr:hypothetical protein [Prolixibacteraceae bacterium]
MDALEKFSSVALDPASYLKDLHKKAGKKFIGVMHPTVPQEVIYAAGLHPYRLFPLQSGQITLAHANLHPYTSSIFRAIWDQYLKGEYPYMDGVALPESCETVTYFARGWKWNRPQDFVATIVVPFKKTANALDFLQQEIKNFTGQVEAFGGKKVTDNSLADSIKLYEKNREYIRKLYALRKQAEPVISGLEFFKIAMANMVMDKNESNILLEELLEIYGKKKAIKPLARVLISGPCVIDSKIYSAIESTGAVIVADDTNMGMRTYGCSVSSSGDHYKALAQAYSQIPCPFSFAAENRLANLEKTCKEYNVGGIIFCIEKACESEKMDFPYLEDKIKNGLGVPLAYLETEYLIDIAPLKTRIDGFIESLVK